MIYVYATIQGMRGVKGPIVTIERNMLDIELATVRDICQ